MTARRGRLGSAVMDRGRVVMGLLFSPRGGSAYVVRYLSPALAINDIACLDGFAAKFFATKSLPVDVHSESIRIEMLSTMTAR